MKKNKWVLEVKGNYTIGDQIVSRTHLIAIPPTNGDRVDIIGESGKYYFGMDKKKFMERMSKEEYLGKSILKLDSKEKEKILKETDWTPRKINDNIAVVIHIRKGEITLNVK